MHLGRLYPYLFEYWEGTCFFWPGYVPRKLFVQCPPGFGSSWDRLAGGIVTGIGVPDVLSVGDPRWTYSDPGGAWNLTVDIHRVSPTPHLEHSLIVRLEEIVPSVASLSPAELFGERTSFDGWAWLPSSNFPPYSLGAVIPMLVRAADWSEV